MWSSISSVPCVTVRFIKDKWCWVKSSLKKKHKKTQKELKASPHPCKKKKKVDFLSTYNKYISQVFGMDNWNQHLAIVDC